MGNQPNPVKLSVAIITFNEEKNIQRCLDSVKDIADEIVVLDSFSVDKTKELSLAAGAKFYTHTFDGHIEQKNRAISLASYHHVLSLDADEALSTQLIASIRSVKKNWVHDGYYFNRLTNYCGHWIHHSGWYPDQKLRLWDSRKGKWGGVNPHDKYLMEPTAKTSFLKGDILHYSYHSIEQHIEQINKFTTIQAQEAFKNGKKASWVKLFLNPLFRFIRSYFFKAGFLDGFYGFNICISSAYVSFMKYVKLRELYLQQKKNENR